jgi:hypothetical protein
MRRSASLIFAEPSPILRASSMVGSSQNFASPSGWLTWTCLRLSSREKKKNRNSPSRKTVGDKLAPPLASYHSLASSSEQGKGSCSRSHRFRPGAMRIRLFASFQLFIGRFREPEPAGRSLPRTTEASSGPCPTTPCPATDLPERSTNLAVVHGSENQLFGWLQNGGWASYPERAAVKHMLWSAGPA